MKLESASRIHSSHGMAGQDDSDYPEPLSGSRYCYLFPELADERDATTYAGGEAKTHAALKALSRSMMGKTTEQKGLNLAPVYTYFGQFISHDIAATVTARDGQFRGLGSGIIAGAPDPSDLESEKRPGIGENVLKLLLNQQARPLSLHSLYGTGPFGESEKIRSFYFSRSPVFKLGNVSPLPDDVGTVVLEVKSLLLPRGAKDIPRNAEGPHLPLIVDRRNDDNLILSQLHLALMLFHNRAFGFLSELPEFAGRGPEEMFDETRRLVTWHYQWCVIHDFLDQLLYPGSLDAALKSKGLLKRQGEVPLEFSTAALRFGHSMVSARYDFNANFGVGGETIGKAFASLFDLFMFTSRMKMGNKDGNIRQLPVHWVPDWNRLIRAVPADNFSADPIDSVIAEPMLTGLNTGPVEENSSIAYRNLLRGFHRRIPFGQALARKLNLDPLPANTLRKMIHPSDDGSYDRDEIAARTPAWLYFLYESEALGSGKAVGPIASLIIAETIIGLMRQDPGSVLTAGKDWTPRSSPLRTPEGKKIDGISDMIAFAGLLA
jgi:Animal haem peroxidase